MNKIKCKKKAFHAYGDLIIAKLALMIYIRSMFDYTIPLRCLCAHTICNLIFTYYKVSVFKGVQYPRPVL